MREKRKERIRVIECQSGAEFEERLNLAFDELTERPGFKFQVLERSSGHCAYLYWNEVERIPQTARDQVELDGVKLYCVDCPNWTPPKDKRKHVGTCPLAPYGMTAPDESACEWFCREVLSGRIKIGGNEE